jgi:transcriptional pleiotropic regulator of transition state genes
MKATGIVRRIDDLGRVVIPKEVRKSCGIKEGDPLEISVDVNTRSVMFTAYTPTPFDWDNVENEFNELSREEKAEIIKKFIELL